MSKTFGFFRNLLPKGQAVSPLNVFINVNSVTSIDIPTANVAYGVRFLMTSNLVNNQTIYYDVVGANASEMYNGSLTGVTNFDPSGNGNVTVYIKPSSNVASNANIVINLRAGSADAEPFYSQTAIIENHTNIVATGGNVTTLANGEKLHSYISGPSGLDSSYNQTAGNAFVQYLIVGGGGAGGTTNLTGDTLYSGAGGGGAGGFLSGNIIQTPINSSVTVGARGVIRPAGSGAEQGYPGGNSSALGFIAVGGGGGGRGGTGYTDSVFGGNGGSGGGGGSSGSITPLSIPGGTGISGQGNAGGIGRISTAQNFGSGGGGGGAGAQGGAADGNFPGIGGNGLPSSITDTTLYYAGGGSGVSHFGTSSRPGSLGGGGASNSDATFYGGGGGGNRNGYQGIVYLRYGPYGKKLVLT